MPSASGTGAARRPVVLCAGIAVEDFLFKVERFAQPGAKVYAQTLVATTGGCAANAAVAVARLGGQARFAGPIGTDEASARFIEGLVREGVDASAALRVAGGSIPVSGIFIDGAGEKMVATHRGENLSGARAPDPQELVADSDIVIADNRLPDFVSPICAAARSRGIPVVLDGDQATRPDDPLFARASHVIFSAEALRATAGITDLAAALAAIARTVHAVLAVTDGAADVLFMDGGRMRHMPVARVKAVDTLGAGDTFHGAFALAVSEGRDLVSALRFAGAAATLKCTRFGGILGTPKRDEVEAFLAGS